MSVKKYPYSIAGVSAEFGYYPIPCDFEDDHFSIKTLSGHAEKVASITRDVNVVGDWIYPAAHQRLDFDGNVRTLPYHSRVFGLPKTHVLTLHASECEEELKFVVWCMSFFTGMRLTTTDAGFLDATPIKPEKLVDFILRRRTLVDSFKLSLNFLEQERNEPLNLQRVAAVIHALFLAQYPQSLPFERFQYLYMALDSCFKLLDIKTLKKTRPSHSSRIQWMCERLGITTPDWAESSITAPSAISVVRNNALHEAIFFDQPLGFSLYGGNMAQLNNENVLLQMKALVCRILVAILGRPNSDYVKSPVNTRMIHALELNL